MHAYAAIAMYAQCMELSNGEGEPLRETVDVVPIAYLHRNNNTLPVYAFYFEPKAVLTKFYSANESFTLMSVVLFYCFCQ